MKVHVLLPSSIFESFSPVLASSPHPSGGIFFFSCPSERQHTLLAFYLPPLRVNFLPLLPLFHFLLLFGPAALPSFLETVISWFLSLDTSCARSLPPPSPSIIFFIPIGPTHKRDLSFSDCRQIFSSHFFNPGLGGSFDSPALVPLYHYYSLCLSSSHSSRLFSSPPSPPFPASALFSSLAPCFFLPFWQPSLNEPGPVLLAFFSSARFVSPVGLHFFSFPNSLSFETYSQVEWFLEINREATPPSFFSCIGLSFRRLLSALLCLVSSSTHFSFHCRSATFSSHTFPSSRYFLFDVELSYSSSGSEQFDFFSSPPWTFQPYCKRSPLLPCLTFSPFFFFSPPFSPKGPEVTTVSFPPFEFLGMPDQLLPFSLFRRGQFNVPPPHFSLSYTRLGPLPPPLLSLLPFAFERASFFFFPRRRPKTSIVCCRSLVSLPPSLTFFPLPPASSLPLCTLHSARSILSLSC